MRRSDKIIEALSRATGKCVTIRVTDNAASPTAFLVSVEDLDIYDGRGCLGICMVAAAKGEA